MINNFSSFQTTSTATKHDVAKPTTRLQMNRSDFNPVPRVSLLWLPCIVRWPAATRVSFLSDKGGREERPWERGWSVFKVEIYNRWQARKKSRDPHYAWFGFKMIDFWRQNMEKLRYQTQNSSPVDLLPCYEHFLSSRLKCVRDLYRLPLWKAIIKTAFNCKPTY